MNRMRVALAQINTVVGDLGGNARKIIAYMQRARQVEADLVLFPELAITGYPPEDLLLKPSFIAANRRALDRITQASGGLTAVVGFADVGDDVYNAAAVVHDGALAGAFRKHHLPTYGVFDEDRYFRSGRTNPVFQVGGVTVGVSICEDIWYPDGPPRLQARGGAQLLANISASPFHAGKGQARERMLATRAADNVSIVAFCNLVGGQDELVFDGRSVILDERGEVIARACQFEEDFVAADVDVGSVFRQRLHDPRWRKEPAADLTVRTLPALASPGGRGALAPHVREPMGRLEEVYAALVVGTRDYVRKNGFDRVVIGLSGGIDSSLVACIAADALGPENVMGVSMPSRYSSAMSRTDAQLLAEKLGASFMVIPIETAFEAYLELLAEPFANLAADVAEENIQARVRGNLLMALSNKLGWLVLTTGNKSEMSVGYATLYGDMAGGFAVIKDVPKVLVYELARWRNAQGEGSVIPERSITRPPTAELRPDQRDTDSLPPYEVLDPILEAYVVEDRSPAEIVEQGFDEETVRRVVSMVDHAEYKRRQAPPGVKITQRAFGRDRRLPIVNHFVED
jgi:NAD+ synthase (glutamine-hydrolysing)